MRIVPVGEHVVVRLFPPEEPRLGEILLPENRCSGALPRWGRVMSVGDGVLGPDGARLPLQIHEGDRVLVAGSAGDLLDLSGDQVLLVSERQILAVVE